MSNSLNNMTFEQRQAIFDEVCPLFTEVLKEKGPLSTDALNHFTRILYIEKFDKYISKTTISLCCEVAERKNLFIAAFANKNDSYARLHEENKQPIQIPSFSESEYLAAYYILYERYLTVKETSDYKNAPEEWLNKIFPPLLKDKTSWKL